MKKIYLKLTEDQINRGVVFSSTLSKKTREQSNDIKHEVFEDESDQAATITRLLDDSFFDGCEHFNYNIVRR